ncbi:carboxypeptidase-like protein [Mucilaginibacter frigoritolerans]|uniref:Carboxypeptidase-like protein n=1 Tax=Mucilaginibacter frigoritolerans TaxID=652788 RepID=A0A562TT17_9SPHI|nr:carboxypeptidase-like regulatory domain-containing protein [Mucilaginibacter frigoritolerans]TWI96731.1 carboxypeptidase-like protein [Mucilaginibacter frigoritolerans]
MRFPWLILLFIFIPFIALAQNGIITGKVVQEGTTKPIPRASVFLSNSSVGSATAEDGTFTLSGIRPGQYTLVVTVLGYEDYNKTVLVGREPIKLNIEMVQKPMMLREVVISSEADFRKNYETFRKEFIGSDLNAKNCVVMNPRILNLTYNPTKQVLHADADEFLIVENRALGYRIKFLLRDFTLDKLAGITSYDGKRIFEDLPGTKSQKDKWHQNRENAYYGSAMHFYRSLHADKLAHEGFELRSYTRSLNLQRPDDETIHKKYKRFIELRMRDSANRMVELSKMSKYVNESISKIPYQEFEVTSTVSEGLYSLHFPHFLYVIYKNKLEEVDFKDIYRDLNMTNYQISVITLTNGPAVFDNNGIVVEGGPLYEGSWSKNRLSDELPVDYIPDKD